MTFAEMVEFVTVKVNQTEAEDEAACESFLTLRHKMVWNDQLWKDSLCMFTQDIDMATAYTASSTWLPTKSVLLLPTVIEKPLAVRTGERRLNVQRPEVYFRADYDYFSKQGMVNEFFLLSPCVWELDTADVLTLNVEANDASLTYLVEAITPALAVTRIAGQLTAEDTALGTSDRIDQFTRSTTSTQSARISGATYGTILTLGTSDLSFARRQRIRLVLRPDDSAAFTVRVLGKRTCPAFANAQDEPAIAGSDALLLALAQADMLQRERQYGKSRDLMDNEVAPLLDQLKRQEVVQQAHNIRITPDFGFKSEYELATPLYQALSF